MHINSEAFSRLDSHQRMMLMRGIRLYGLFVGRVTERGSVSRNDSKSNEKVVAFGFHHTPEISLTVSEGENSALLALSYLPSKQKFLRNCAMLKFIENLYPDVHEIFITALAYWCILREIDPVESRASFTSERESRVALS